MRNACDIDTLHEDVVMRDFYMKDVGKCAKVRLNVTVLYQNLLYCLLIKNKLFLSDICSR